MFTWIIFDIDDTLLDFHKSESAALAETMKHFSLPAPDNFHKIYQSVNFPLWQALERGEITVKEIKKKRFGHFALELGKKLTIEESTECNRFYLNQLALQAPLLKGAEIVRDLKLHYKLAILTNGMELTQRKRMEHSGLNDCFSCMVTSERTGFAKPDKRIFEEIWRQMEKPEKEKVLMVGDNALSDISGARVFGFKTCWINRKQVQFPYDWQPDHIIENPEDLFFLLEN